MSGREIYKIKRTDDVDYEEFAGFVIVASDKEECIKFAREYKPIDSEFYTRREPKNVWESAEITVLGKPYKDTPSGVILDDFWAA